MTDFLNNNLNLLNQLLNTYERVMHLKLFVDSDDNQLKNMYYMAADNHNKKLQNSCSAPHQLFVQTKRG